MTYEEMLNNLEKDDETIILIEEVDNEELITFEIFKTNLTNYILYDKRANVDTFKLWQAFNNFINKAQDYDVMVDNKVCLIIWLKNDWNAFLKSILDNNFQYMNISKIVLESWEEFCK